MGNIGWLKRVLPFLVTFALGLFIASFFVNIGSPRIGNRGKCRHEVRELRIENENLRLENQRLIEQQSQMLEFPDPPPAYLENEDRVLPVRIPGVDEPVPVLPPPPPVRVHKRSQ